MYDYARVLPTLEMIRDEVERSKMKALLEAVDLSGARWFVNKYGISAKEAAKLVGHPKQKEIIREIEDWREKHGFPAPNSPIARGKLMAILKKA